MSSLIWIQSNWHSDGISEIIFQKSWFWKKSVDDKKAWKIFQGAKIFKTLYYMLTPLKYHVFENTMENGAFAL